MKPAIWTGMYAELPLHEALQTLNAHGWTAFEASTEHLVQIETDDDAGEPIALDHGGDTGRGPWPEHPQLGRSRFCHVRRGVRAGRGLRRS